MNYLLAALVASVAIFANPVLATEYIYRDLMANTLPSPGCSAEGLAIALASKPYNIKNYSKRFCQTQGYGWHVEAIKDNGKAVCTDCAGGQKKCHVEDVVVTCKRIKPGSVGMLPGKS
ncbi:MAG: hypothetical protein NTV43_12790 [Methylococcales bacterium]|nr:hypothetical protein [Methylococcales bacterium]